MLVLGRRSTQSILIGDKIRISVVRVRGNTAWLAIQAPKEVPVHREEVALRIRREDGEGRPAA